MKTLYMFPITKKGGFRYPANSTIKLSGDCWRRWSSSGKTWTPETSRRMAERMVYYAETGRFTW